MDEQAEMTAMDSLATTWVDAKCRTQTVETVRDVAETDTELEARHDARVGSRIRTVGEKAPVDDPGHTAPALSEDAP